MGALNNNGRNILTTWSTECPTTLSTASIGAAALAAGAPAVRREGPVRRWPWQQRWLSSWRQSSSILFIHLLRLQDIFGKDIYSANAADVIGVTVYGVRVFLVLMARRSRCLDHHMEHIQLLFCLSLGAAAVSGTQTLWGLRMTVISPSFSCMEKFTDGR